MLEVVPTKSFKKDLKKYQYKKDIIKELYDGLMGFYYNQYQLPLHSHWEYELQTAKQYLNRYEAHMLFACWFIVQNWKIIIIHQKHI